MDDPDPSPPAYVDRPPRNFVERLFVNCRPQPAIPAVIVFFFAVILPIMSQSPGTGADDAGFWLTLLVSVGIIASCALAIGASFCSVFPQAAWFVLARWSLGLPTTGVMPVYNQVLILLGMAAMAGMLVYQVWRVRVGKFVPTIREYE
jgi:hypothetical protein